MAVSVLAFCGLAVTASAATAATQCDVQGCYTVRCDSYGYCNRSSGYEVERYVAPPDKTPAAERTGYVRTQVCDSTGCRVVYEPRVEKDGDEY